MRCLLLLLFFAILSFLAFVFFKKKILRTAISKMERNEKLWKRKKTEKPSIKREEPWIKVVKQAEHVRELCKEWGSERSFPLKQGDTIIDPDGQKHRAFGNEVWSSDLGEQYEQRLRLSSHLVSRKLNISYCWIHKVASTSWQSLFLRLENNSVHLKQDTPYRTMFWMAPRSSKEFAEIAGSFYNFLLVRHPFTRLVSGFRDRVESCKMEAEWYTRVREAMQLNGGPVCYIRMNIGKLENDGGKLLGMTRGVEAPTFPQFVQYLLWEDPGKWNNHWRPYHLHCTPCIGKLTAVGKLEEAGEQTTILKASGLAAIGNLLDMNRAQVPSENVTDKYFQMLTCQQKNDLYSRLKIDFHLFDYSPDPYLRGCHLRDHP